MAINFLQWLGSGTVLAGTSLLGGMMAKRFRDRPRELRDLAAMLRVLAAEISFVRAPLTEALERSARATGRASPIRDLLTSVAGHMRTPGVTAEMAWRSASAEHLQRTALSHEDYEIVATLVQTLGQTGAEEQAGMLMAATTLLTDREREAVVDRERYARLYLTIGILTGVLIIVLLI